MTDNLPAVPEPAKPADVARTDTDSWVNVMRPTIALAEHIAHTEFVPKSLRSVPATTAAILYGREVGLPPMTSLTQTHVIEGKPSMSAEAMRAMVISQGHELIFDEATGAICRMRARRRESQHWTELHWTIDMARAAGLLGKSNWKSYPRAMLIARCTADLCRMVFPDVILGFRSVEEMTDLGAEELEPAEAPADQGTTSVRRGRKPAKKTAAAPAAIPAPQQQHQQPAGPPLPGEPGFEDQARSGAPVSPGDGETTSAGESDDGSSATHAEEIGEDIEDPTADVVDAETVEEPTDTPQTAEAGDAAEPGVEAGEPASVPRKASKAMQRMIFASLGERGVDNSDDEERHLIASKIVGRPIASFNDLTVDEAKVLIDTVARTKDRDQLWAMLDEIDAAAADQGDES